jgi:uncharacterized membrane protein
MTTHTLAHGGKALDAAIGSNPLAGFQHWIAETLSPLDAVAIGISLSLVVGYHLYLRWRLRHDHSYSIQSVNRQARAAWVRSIMGGPGQEILGVQTLRNSTMAATFLASTAILLIMGTLNLLQQTDLGDGLLSTLNGGAAKIGLGHCKLLALLVDFFWAFFCFSQAVRLYNHVGYLISAGISRQGTISPQYVARLLNRSGRYYSLGMRCYYVSVPLVFWLFGPYPLIVSSAALVSALYHIDRSPEIDETEEITSKASDDVPARRAVARPSPGSMSVVDA